MSGITWKQWRTMAWCVACCPALSAFAQDSVGIVRISDGPKGSVQAAGYSKGGHGQYHAMHGGGSGQSYGQGYGGDCPSCQSGCCQKHGCLSGKFQERYCTNAADYGYSIPGKYPIHRRGVQYNQTFPSQWYGSPGFAMAEHAYPTVYQPTDTLQLGFYGQHVPFWQPQPNPLPQRPIPAQWHNYAPAVPASAFHNGWAWGYGPGHGIHSDCPVSYETVPSNASPTPTNLQPVPNEPPPAPVPLQESAADTSFRRAGF